MYVHMLTDVYGLNKMEKFFLFLHNFPSFLFHAYHKQREWDEMRFFLCHGRGGENKMRNKVEEDGNNSQKS